MLKKYLFWYFEVVSSAVATRFIRILAPLLIVFFLNFSFTCSATNSFKTQIIETIFKKQQIRKKFKKIQLVGAPIYVRIWLPPLGRLPHNIKIGICQAFEAPFAQGLTCCCYRDMVWNPRNILCRDTDALLRTIDQIKNFCLK